MTDTREPAGETLGAEPGGASDLLVGTVLSGRYRIEQALGVGGMGAVYRAEHTLMRKRVAVKVLHPEMTRMPEVVARFEREAMAAAHIEHPNVAAATDFGKLDDGSFFLVLEFVEGVALRDVVHQGALPASRAIHIARQIAAALVRAHSLGIVHRDLKPENVMLVARDGDPDFVKVLDFGIAKVPVGQFSRQEGEKHQTLTRAGMIYGTPEYMAPEQALGQEIDARADLYALGIILYEMLAGRRPFESDNPVALLGMQVTTPPPLLRDITSALQLPGDLEALVMSLLEKLASRRPADAKHVLDALDQAALLADGVAGDGVAATMPAPPVPTPSALLTPGSRLDAFLAQAAPVVRDARRVLSGWGLQTRLDDLRGKLPSPLRAVPLVAWAAGTGSVALIVLLSGITLFCLSNRRQEAKVMLEPGRWIAPGLSASVAAAAEVLSDEKLAEALLNGPAAVEELAARFPQDPRPVRLLARAWTLGGEFSKALAAYRRLFQLAPAARTETEVQDTIGLIALRPETEDDAFQLMEREMGSAGVDVLYRLAVDPRGNARRAKASQRAAKSLKTPSVRTLAAPVALIAIDLREAASCESKYKLLERAKADGDERTLVQLRPLLSDGGCGFLGLADCWRCMRRSNMLGDAIKLVDDRLKNRAK